MTDGLLLVLGSPAVVEVFKSRWMMLLAGKARPATPLNPPVSRFSSVTESAAEKACAGIVVSPIVTSAL